MTLPSARRGLLKAKRAYVQQTSDTLPAMTANNAPAGHAALAGGGTAYFGMEPYAWRVFSKGDETIVDFALQDPKTGWVQRKTPSAIRVWRFGVRGRSGALNQCPLAFGLYGSNDGSSFALLRTVTGQTDWTDLEERFFDVPEGARGSFLYHRLTIEDNNGSAATGFNEIYLLQEV